MKGILPDAGENSATRRTMIGHFSAVALAHALPCEEAMTQSRSTVVFAIVAASALAACSSRPSQSVIANASAQTATPAPAAKAPAPADKRVTPIADVWKNRTTLAGKQVTLHGKVVKFNGGILGVNWIHIQDGTGKAEDGSNDITITTDPSVGARVGDEITVTGTVVINKDLGSGYFYSVMLEKATIKG
jgi:hypothetical protein